MIFALHGTEILGLYAIEAVLALRLAWVHRKLNRQLRETALDVDSEVASRDEADA
jgi:hypothetical protein